MGATLAEETDGAGNTLVRYACAASGADLAQQSYRIVDGAVVEQKTFDPYGDPSRPAPTPSASRAPSPMR
jgi:hypothetical protein